MTDVIFDCTELYQNPVRTGIQRVVREMLRQWPDDAQRLHVVRYDMHMGLVRLSDYAVRVLTDEEPGTAHLTRDELAAVLAKSTATPSSSPLPEDAVLFIPEVFYDPLRCRHYEWLMTSYDRTLAMLAYDFIPYLKPYLFNLRSCVSLMEYLRLIARASHVACISGTTCWQYRHRITRDRSSSKGRVLPLGADGLGLERQRWRSDRRGFVAFGSIDNRKNQHLILQAFQELWNEGVEAPLTLIGSAFASVDIAWLEGARSLPAFRWIRNASDEDIGRELSSARGTLYVSEAEGYGLPPVESLAVGIPVISTSDMPSLVDLAPGGQLRLERPTVASIKEAVTQMIDDERAIELWGEAAKIVLPTWADLAQATAEWLEQVSQTQRAAT